MDTTAMVLLPFFIGLLVYMVVDNFPGAVFKFFFGPWPGDDRTIDRIATRIIGFLFLCVFVAFVFAMGWALLDRILFPRH